jgi:Tfp pilus assembly PilM family ATPase
MARRVIGLDFGAYSVKLVRLEASKQNYKFDVLDSVEEILPISLQEEDDSDVISKQIQALKNLQSSGLLDAETFACGLNAIDAHMRSMIVPFTDLKKIQSILPGMLEAEVPFEIQDMIIPWYLKSVVEEKETNQSLSSINLAFGKKTAISSMLQLLQSFSIDPRIINLSSAAPYELLRELGKDAFFYEASLSSEENKQNVLSAIIDLGHTSTNICLFDSNGFVFSKSILKGGLRLSEKIAKELNIDFIEAQNLKHQLLDSKEDEQEKSLIIKKLTTDYYNDIFAEIIRTFITCKSKDLGEVKSFGLIGGACQSEFITTIFKENFLLSNCHMIDFKNILPLNFSPSKLLSLAHAFSCLHLHAKEGRFNFRKNEFVWRGNFDFLKNQSTPLILWSLIIVCTMIIFYFTNSLVLGKELELTNKKLEDACFSILGKKNLTSQKCLSQIKEQINKNVSLGIPTVSSTDLYLKISLGLGKSLEINLDEIDIAEKRLRITGETSSYENVEKVVVALSKVDCLKKIEKTNARQVGKNIKFQLASDIDCNENKTK